MIALIRSSEPVAALALWLLKWFEAIGFFLILQSLLDRDIAKRVINYVLLSGSLLAAYAVLAVGFNFTGYRIRVFFGNPNTLGSFFVLLTLLSFGFAASFSGRRRFLYLTTGITGSLAVMMTGSRSALLALVVGVGILALNRQSDVSPVLLVVSVLSVAGALLFVVTFLPQERADRLVSWITISGGKIAISQETAGSSFAGRLRHMYDALVLTVRQPVFGYGWYGASAPIGFSDVYYTMLLVEVGDPGFVLTILYHLSLFRGWITARMQSPSALGGAGLAWYCSLLVQSVGGNFPRTPQMMLLTVLVLSATYASGLEEGSGTANESPDRGAIPI
jgi:hypothetical protein